MPLNQKLLRALSEIAVSGEAAQAGQKVLRGISDPNSQLKRLFYHWMSRETQPLGTNHLQAIDALLKRKVPLETFTNPVGKRVSLADKIFRGKKPDAPLTLKPGEPLSVGEGEIGKMLARDVPLQAELEALGNVYNRRMHNLKAVGLATGLGGAGLAGAQMVGDPLGRQNERRDLGKHVAQGLPAVPLSQRVGFALKTIFNPEGAGSDVNQALVAR